MTISEKALKNAIISVLMENRKVLKVGNSAPSMPQMDMQQQPMDMGIEQPMGADPSMGEMPTDPSMGEMPADQSGENQFDTNFDAGVEADEETDPKRYIQQLTGKLSQSLNSFNADNGTDPGLSKYVASMIIAAACKNLDEKAKKELIEKINTASSDEPDMDDDGLGDEQNMSADNKMQPEEQPQKQMLQERIITKKELFELTAGLGAGGEERKTTAQKVEPKEKSIFSGKSFR